MKTDDWTSVGKVIRAQDR